MSKKYLCLIKSVSPYQKEFYEIHEDFARLTITEDAELTTIEYDYWEIEKLLKKHKYDKVIVDYFYIDSLNDLDDLRDFIRLCWEEYETPIEFFYHHGYVIDNNIDVIGFLDFMTNNL